MAEAKEETIREWDEENMQQQLPEAFTTWCDNKMNSFADFKMLNLDHSKNHTMTKHGHQLFPEMIEGMDMLLSILFQGLSPSGRDQYFPSRVEGHSQWEMQTGLSTTHPNLFCYGLTGVADIIDTDKGPVYKVVTFYPWREDDRVKTYGRW